MPLNVHSRRVTGATILTCSGRLVDGAESVPLRRALDELIAFPNPRIVLDLAGVDFLDSAGLGLLVRYVSRSRTAGGQLLLCSVPHKVSEVLRLTRLRSVFETFESEAEAVSASDRGAPDAAAQDGFSADILCVEVSVDVQCYVRALLAQEGHRVLTVGNLPDALVLLQTIRPKIVIVSADLRASRATWSAERFNALADRHAVVELPPGFSGDDAGQSGQRLVDDVRRVAAAR